MANPTVEARIGAVALFGAGGSSGYNRASSGQTANQVGAGLVSDLSGITYLSVAGYGPDPATGNYMNVSGVQMGRMSVFGAAQFTGTTLLVGGTLINLSSPLPQGAGGYTAFQSEADGFMQQAYASRGLTPNGMKVMVDPGVRGSINLQDANIIYREMTLEPQQLTAVRPFDQALSDAGGQPIRAVIGDQGTYIMQGNHRVFGATLDNLNSVDGILYTPQQWESFTGSTFNPTLGTTTPKVR